MSETPHYRVEHPSMSGLQGYLNRAYESGWEVVSVAPVDSTMNMATVVLQPRIVAVRERKGWLPMRLRHAFTGHPAEMVEDEGLALRCECGWRLLRGDWP